jgi:leader peptidase (prepilin peptidase)/N-methyltransferase
MTFIGQFGRLPYGIQLGFVAIYGAVFGSFLTMLSYRLPRMMMQALMSDEELVGEPRANLFQASACPHCGHRIAPWFNIPVGGWIIARGRCGHCHERISVRYPLIELASLIAAVACFARFGATLQAGAAFAFVWALLLAAVIDLETMYLPDTVTLPLLWLGLILAVSPFSMVSTPANAILGASLGYGVLFLLSRSATLLTGQEMMGEGDLKLMAAVGAWVGWQQVPLVLLVASIASVIAHGVSRLRCADAAEAAFGPWIAVGAWLIIFMMHGAGQATGMFHG